MPPLPTLTAATLTAVAASVNPGTRTITGTIAPYGIPGRTSARSPARAPWSR